MTTESQFETQPEDIIGLVEKLSALDLSDGEARVLAKLLGAAHDTAGFGISDPLSRSSIAGVLINLEGLGIEKWITVTNFGSDATQPRLPRI